MSGRALAGGLVAAALAAAGSGCRDTALPERCELAFSGQGSVRVLAVGHHFTLEDAHSYDTFEASFRRHLPAIRPCLSDSRPNLIAFPEEAGLMAWFIGRRAMLGRGSPDTGTAFNAVYAGYYRTADAYRARFPGISSGRAMGLALSDTVWRAMHRTFGRIARETGAWVITSGNAADARLTHHPELVAAFGDPDVPAAEGAYVADRPEVFNKAMLYGPDGLLVETVDKAYLTGLETTLDMSFGSLERARVFDTPFARIGAPISRDAFYPPYLERLEDLGVELVVQPEAWSDWTVEVPRVPWRPDHILASGWVHTQKHRAFRHSVAPMYVGNLWDSVFDGQVWITQKLRPDQPAMGFVGSQTQQGWVAIGPWTYEDADRDRLRELGRKLAPGSGAPEENRYRDSLVGADLSLYGSGPAPAIPVAPSGGVAATVPVAPSAAGHQTAPDAAYDQAGLLYAAWSDARGGRPRIYLATSPTGGAGWTAAVPVEAAGSGAQLRPAVAAAARDVVAVAWQERSGGREVVRVAVSRNGGQGFAAPVPVDAAPEGSQWAPGLAFSPAGDVLAVAWMDFRGGALEPRIRWARSTDLGATFTASAEVDGATEKLRSQVRDSQAQPTVAWTAEGLAVAWTGYRSQQWEVMAAIAPDGAAFGPPVNVTPPTPHGEELLATEPHLSAGPQGELVVVWNDWRQYRPHQDVRGARREGGAWVALPLLQGGAEEGAFFSRFRPSAAAIGGAIQVAFQDTSPGKSGLGLARLPAERLPVRLDDSGAAGNQLTRPRMAARRDGSGGAVVFEDDRDGFSRVYSAPLR